MSIRNVLVVAALLAAPSAGFAQGSKEAAAPAVTLKPGMPAPAIAVEKWVKGSPVASFEKGKVYVVEFWATWCGPCIAQMPHLSAMSRQYRPQGVTFIGMTSTDSRGNTLDKVEAMVADNGDGMDYTVAWDQGRTTNEAFLKASGQTGIPCSFLIDKQGEVAFIGHPMFLDEPLAEVVAGTWDTDTDGPEVQKPIDEYRAIGKTLRTDPKAGIAAITAFETSHPKLAHLVEDMKFFGLLQAGEFDAAYAAAGKMVDHAIEAKDPAKLNQIAWTIVDPEAKLEKRDLELAMRAAAAAVDLTERKDGLILDTLARAYAWKGDYKKALELQTIAIELAPEKAKASLQPALDEYKAKAAL